MGRNGKTNKSISEFETSGGNNEEKKQVNGKAQRGAEKERIMMGRLGRQRGRGGQGEMELVVRDGILGRGGGGGRKDS